MIRMLVFFLGVVFAAPVFSQALYRTVEGRKFPNSPQEGSSPITTREVVPLVPLGGFNELLPFVTPSPDQEDAGTCLYMSLTGVAEWWLHKLSGTRAFVPDGPLDLSERWWVNKSSAEARASAIENAFNDTILMYNDAPGVLNRDYRFTKGWFTVDAEEELHPASPRAPGAQYGTQYNWIDETTRVKPPTFALPRFSREILLQGKEDNPWEIGAAPADIVGRVKEALRTKKAPVQIVYNHSGYWHSVFIVGYDDEARIGDCSFTRSVLQEMKDEADAAAKEAGDAKDPRQRDEALSKEKKYRGYQATLTASLATKGCGSKGVFYVRDSIYSDPSEPVYRFDPGNPAADTPYSKRIVLRELDWILHLANHVTVITAVPAVGK